jgi:HSP20 family molecular chaperone IbpA
MKELKEMTRENAEHTRERRLYTPSVDIVERKNDILLLADMPGVDENGLDITLEKRVLTIYGRVDAEAPEKYTLVSSEYGIGDYQRSFTLSEEVDTEKIQATIKNGVLRLVLPKADTARVKKIPVAVGA